MEKVPPGCGGRGLERGRGGIKGTCVSGRWERTRLPGRAPLRTVPTWLPLGHALVGLTPAPSMRLLETLGDGHREPPSPHSARPPAAAPGPSAPHSPLSAMTHTLSSVAVPCGMSRLAEGRGDFGEHVTGVSSARDHSPEPSAATVWGEVPSQAHLSPPCPCWLQLGTFLLTCSLGENLFSLKV